MENQIHEYQISILKELLFKPNARFRDLKKIDIPNDHFTFHLKQLVKNGLVEKRDNTYRLTPQGKEFANRIDTEALQFEKQAKLSVAIHAVRERNGKIEYLIHKRLKEPFFGWYGSHSGKVRFGETPLDCAQREFLEETGLTGVFQLKAILHYLNLNSEEQLLEDKYMWLYKVTNTKGVLLKSIEGGENIWMSEEEYRALPHSFATFEAMFDALNKDHLVYIERKKVVEEF